MEPKDLSDEEWREYAFPLDGNEKVLTYRIMYPKTLYVGGTTHRVVDSEGIVHCVPGVGFHGCVLRWKPRDTAKPVQF